MSKSRLDDSIFGAPPPPADTRRARREQRRMPRRPPKRRRWAAMLVALGVLGGGGFLAAQYVSPMVEKYLGAKDFDGPGSGEAVVDIPPGTTIRGAGDLLQEAGVVKTALAFQDAFQGRAGAELHPGSYRLQQKMKAIDVVEALMDGDHRNEYKIAIREGMWKNEIFTELAKNTGNSVDAYVAAEKEIAASGGMGTSLPAAAKGNLEGYLFPATYSFPKTMSPEDQLNAMVSKAMQQYTALGISGPSMQRTVIMASLVEAEARKAVDRPKVARVIENRLKINMPLQLDSTVSYGVKRRGVTTTDAERADANKYNTYKHLGLPVGPIGNPGVASLKAVMNPAEGKWLYFVAVNPQTGETKYGENSEQHAANVKEFQNWCNRPENKGTC